MKTVELSYSKNNPIIKAKFSITLDRPKYTKQLAFQFIEQQKEVVKKTLKSLVKTYEGKISNWQDDLLCVFECDFDKNLEDGSVDIIKQKLYPMFPIIAVKTEV